MKVKAYITENRAFKRRVYSQVFASKQIANKAIKHFLKDSLTSFNIEIQKADKELNEVPNYGNSFSFHDWRFNYEN